VAFDRLLRDLVNRTDGAIGAMFLDHEGEAVEIVGSETPREELHLVGAYQAVFLDRLRKICDGTATGRPERFEILLENTVFLNYVLDEEYYVVLVIDRNVPRGIAWEALRKCRERINDEI